MLSARLSDYLFIRLHISTCFLRFKKNPCIFITKINPAFLDSVKSWKKYPYLRSTVKAACKNSLVLCHVKTLHLYTSLFNFKFFHYLTCQT